MHLSDLFLSAGQTYLMQQTQDNQIQCEGYRKPRVCLYCYTQQLYVIKEVAQIQITTKWKTRNMKNEV